MISAMTFHPVARRASISILGLILALTLALPARAVSLLRDADLEYALAQLATPVLKAAGLSAARTKILVVDDGSLNAFVIGNDAIYIHSGLIGRMENAAMLQAVIAHEAAHIANGHITRRMTNMGSARTAAGLGMALAVIAAAAGGGEAAGAIAVGTQSAAMRAFLTHTRPRKARPISPARGICAVQASRCRVCWMCSACSGGRKCCQRRARTLMCALTR